MNDCIDHENQLSGKEITLNALRWKYGTYRAIYDGKDRLGHKKYRSRTGVQTESGDIEISLWYTLVERLIEENGEQELFEALIKWGKENCPFLKTENEVKEEALKAYCIRIFDNPNWSSYAEFNSRFRPETSKKKGK